MPSPGVCSEVDSSHGLEPDVPVDVYLGPVPTLRPLC